MRRFFIIFVCLLVIVGAAVWVKKSGRRDGWVIVRGEKFLVEIADEETEQVQGLSGRQMLCKKCGMLFVYATAAPRIFWMKDMNFPLDFVWIRDSKIVELTSNVPAPAINEPPAVISPRESSDMVLEVPAGTITRLGIKIGDTIRRK